MVGVEGIEPLAATPLNDGHRVTAGDGEQHPCCYWWTDGGSNPNLCGASAACSHYHYQPIDGRSTQDRTEDLLFPKQTRYQAALYSGLFGAGCRVRTPDRLLDRQAH